MKVEKIDLDKYEKSQKTAQEKKRSTSDERIAIQAMMRGECCKFSYEDEKDFNKAVQRIAHMKYDRNLSFEYFVSKESMSIYVRKFYPEYVLKQQAEKEIQL